MVEFFFFFGSERIKTREPPRPVNTTLILGNIRDIRFLHKNVGLIFFIEKYNKIVFELSCYCTYAFIYPYKL